MTIRARGNTAGALVSGTNAIVVNAAATDKVTIDGLDINGIGTGAPTSLSGIKVLSASRVNILNNEIYRFRSGVTVVPTSATTRVMMKNNIIQDNGIGVINAPGSNSITNSVVTLRNNLINDNTCGVVTGAFGTNASTPTTTDCGTAPFSVINKPVFTRIWRNGIFDNSFGVFARGANSLVDIGYSEIAGNSTFGLRRFENGVMRTTSPATNVLSNAADDAPTLTQPLG